MAFRRTTRRRTPSRLGAVALAAASVVLGPTSPAIAGDGVDFGDLQSRRSWTGFADARPISPYEGLPLEMAQGFPLSRTYLDATPGRSEAYAAFYYLAEIIDEGVFETTAETTGYKNHTMSRCNNPDQGRGIEAELGNAAAGPYEVVKCPTRTDATSFSSYGPVRGEAVSFQNSTGTTSTHLEGDDRLISESTSKVSGLVLPGGVKVGSLESWVKLEIPVGQEPLVSYRLTMFDVGAGEQSLASGGQKGLHLSGSDVPSSDLHRQFQEQANQNGDAISQLATWKLHLAEPRVHEEFGEYTITAPVIEGRLDNAPFKDRLFGYMGLRLGWAQVHGVLTAIGPAETTTG